MSSDLIGLLIPALASIVIVMLAVGLPALAFTAVRFFKFKEREMVLEMEHRQKSQQEGLFVERRVQRLEEALTSLDQNMRDVRARMGIDLPASLEARPDLVEGPAAPDAERGQPLDPPWMKAR